MNIRAPSSWQVANQAALVEALRPVYAALRRAAGDAAEEPLFAEPATVDGPPGALDSLCELFGLTPFERGLLLLCAGVELEGRFTEACAAAHRDPKRTWATFGLALTALPGAHWSALTRDRPLRYWRMLEVLPGGTLAGSALRIDERILHFIAGVECTDDRLEGIVHLSPTPPTLPSWLTGPTKVVARALREGERVALTGRAAADRDLVATAALSAAGLHGYRLRISDIPALPVERELLARHWTREALLVGGGLYLHGDGDEPGETRRLLRPFLTRATTPTVIDVQDVSVPDALAMVRVALPEPSADDRRRAWSEGLGVAAARMDGTLDMIANQFRLDRRAICSASAALRHLAANSEGDEFHQAAWRVCRDYARQSMDGSARRITPKATWENLVLPEPQMNILRQIAAQLRQRTTVHERWGFEARYARGLGLTALFSGTSGTGKTMAAEVLAHELELDLFQIDLAGLVNKYIGETEKNLKRVFDAAEDSGAILLFDEADALFGKRTEVKDSHDRYANLEVSYLLQRMEAYRGLAILTTNMRHAIDHAFLRRIRFIIEFPFPDEAHRTRIWRGVFPPETPTKGLDPERLAQLSIPGGIIRNIALQAAFLAADEAEPVRMSHLLQAARTEYGKLEKPLSTSQLGGWL